MVICEFGVLRGKNAFVYDNASALPIECLEAAVYLCLSKHINRRFDGIVKISNNRINIMVGDKDVDDVLRASSDCYIIKQLANMTVSVRAL
jgi:hypothetical protein